MTGQGLTLQFQDKNIPSEILQSMLTLTTFVTYLNGGAQD
jgi:hypothetical protein